jgi:hypothetical protein|mmetsp:Transcript_12368/g.22502  ORF Transcript_12368/g.22502 Transcript_12368/m.22502 type:complete len:97 (-) Transcript_12368:44-334(-)
MLSELAWFERQLEECGLDIPRDVRVSERSQKKKEKAVFLEANFALAPDPSLSPSSSPPTSPQSSVVEKRTPSPAREPGRGSRKKKTSLKKLENYSL